MKVVLIGRDKDKCDHIVNDQFVSRVHLQIVKLDDGTYSAFDLESSTGTFVNGKRIIKETALNKDDILKIGNTVLKWNSYFIDANNKVVDDRYKVKDYDQNEPLLNLNYASFWSRVWASLLDSVIIFILLFLADKLLISIINEYYKTHVFYYTNSIDRFMYDYSIFVFNAFFVMMYFAFAESSNKQATIGKRALGIKVIDLDGNRISFINAIGRHISKFFSAFILYIGFLMPLWTKKKQTLHDMMASCVVIKE